MPARTEQTVEDLDVEEAYIELVGEIAYLLDFLESDAQPLPMLMANFVKSVAATIHMNRNTTIH